MKIYDLNSLSTEKNHGIGTLPFHEEDTFKNRIIDLEKGASMPACDMTQNVIFMVLSGEITVHHNDQSHTLSMHQMFVSEPATLSMTTKEGARVLGIQIDPEDMN